MSSEIIDENEEMKQDNKTKLKTSRDLDSDPTRSLSSVSISLIVNLTRKDEGLVIHQQSLTTITFIGLVLSIEEDGGKVTCSVDDQSFGSPIDVSSVICGKYKQAIWIFNLN